jgi:hypothetical protein
MIPATVADATTHNGISRRAKHRACVCGAVILVGLDADRAAGEARVDVTPLTAVGEALAILTGRATYLRRGAFRLELDHRSSWHIAGASADDVTVLAEHRCGAPALPTKPVANNADEKESPDAPPY